MPPTDSALCKKNATFNRRACFVIAARVSPFSCRTRWSENPEHRSSRPAIVFPARIDLGENHEVTVENPRQNGGRVLPFPHVGVLQGQAAGCIMTKIDGITKRDPAATPPRAMQPPAEIDGLLQGLGAGRKHAGVRGARKGHLADPRPAVHQNPVHDGDLTGRSAALMKPSLVQDPEASLKWTGGSCDPPRDGGVSFGAAGPS